MEVAAAQEPTIGAGEGDGYGWQTTRQVGGDAVYGWGGEMVTGGDVSEPVGKSVNDGVLGKVIAKEGTKCRGAINGNDSVQALWVFSSDACGVYGLSHVAIAHAGRTDPQGVIILSSTSGKVDVPSGAGMLLRVDGSRP
jgi:hypothetical protein